MSDIIEVISDDAPSTIIEVIADDAPSTVIEVIERGPRGEKGEDGAGGVIVRETDGTPSATVTTLEFPNGSITIDGGKATIDVGGLDPIPANTLLGNPTGSTALPTPLPDEQVRTLLSAQESFFTLITGNVSRFSVTKPVSEFLYSSFIFQSHSGADSGGFGEAYLSANPEDGVRFGISNTDVGYAYGIAINPSGYTVDAPAAFRTAINAAEASHTHDISTLNWATIYARTTNPGVAGQPWNDGGTLKFSAG
jgi:hypothetical protein